MQLFFLLSAMLTWKSLEHYFENTEFSITTVLGWWKNKFLKLIPLWYLAILLYSIGTSGSIYWLGSEGKITIWNVLAHVFFLHGLFPHWTNSIMGIEWYLGALAIFYFFAPFLYKIVNSLKRALLAVFVSEFFFSFFHKWISSYYPNVEDVYIYKQYIKTNCILPQLSVLFLGVALFFLLKGDSQEQKREKNRNIAYCTVLILAMIILYGYVLKYNGLDYLNEYTLFGIIFFLLALSQRIRNWTLINNPLTRVLGRYSWPIYLFHYYIINRFNHYVHLNTGSVTLSWIITFISVTACSLFAGVILTRFVDNAKLIIGRMGDRV